MRGVSVRCAALLLATALAGQAWGFHSSLRRYTRQAIHCQAGDEACQACSTSCNSVEESRLPECCEAYNACCDQYFQACKKCSSVAAKDRYFPEYCCASFTDCCHLVTTFNAPVKPPEPVKKKSLPDLEIPAVAAPKPTVFPGFQDTPDSFAPAAVFIPSHAPTPKALALPSPIHAPAPQAPALPAHSPAPQAPELRVPSPQPPAQQVVSPQLQAQRVASPQLQTERASVGRQRVQSNSQPRRASRPQQSPSSSRRGRVTSRGRVIQ